MLYFYCAIQSKFISFFFNLIGDSPIQSSLKKISIGICVNKVCHVVHVIETERDLCALPLPQSRNAVKARSDQRTRLLWDWAAAGCWYRNRLVGPVTCDYTLTS